jgi:Kef-type K+ transport system membrane component KefB
MKTKWKEASVVGVASFLVPAVGCTVVALWWIGWSLKAAAIAGIALSTTSVAVVYSVMLETGLNDTDYGKIALAACFITDIGTVLALGVVFSPFNLKTLVFVLTTWWMCKVLPKTPPKYMTSVWDKPSEVAAKFILMILLAMGAMALWAENEPVLPAYVMGMALAGTMGQNKVLTRELRTVTRGILTPFFFIHAGALVSLPALFAAPAGFVVLFSAKIAFKFLGVYPSTRRYKTPRQEAMYTTLLMSTGLTFGAIAAMFGLTHDIIDRSQYSILAASVIATAVIPAIIADAFFLPRHLLADSAQTARAREDTAKTISVG